MADIVIRGMEMPKDEPLTITITPEGKVFRAFIPGSYSEVIPLPEGHGRLVDEDEVKTRMTRKMDACKHNSVDELTYAVCIDIVDHADTIVPAEGD